MSIWCQFTCQRSHMWRRMRFILNSFRQWSSCKLKQKYLKRNKSMALSSTLVLVFHLRLVCSVYQTPWKKLIYAIFFMQSDAKQADQNALLVLRNIKVLGFENGNRFQGFDKGTTFKILEVNSIALVLSNCVRWMFMCIEQTMADMHALPIAIRILKPRRFEKTFRPHFKPIDMTYIDPKILPKVYYDWSFVSYIYLIRRSQAVHYDLKYVRINQTLRRKVDAQIKNCIAFSQINKNGSDTPYSTVVHRDLWTNNFMISKGICVDWQSPPAQLMAEVSIHRWKPKCQRCESLWFSAIFLSLIRTGCDIFLVHQCSPERSEREFWNVYSILSSQILSNTERCELPTWQLLIWIVSFSYDNFQLILTFAQILFLPLV